MIFTSGASAFRMVNGITAAFHKAEICNPQFKRQH